MKFKFNDCLVNTETSQLMRGGEEIPLEPLAFDLLVLLIEQRDRVVSKDEIIERLWAGRFTSDAAIATCIKTLRKALQDNGDQQRCIRTQRGRGFRFIAPVAEANTETETDSAIYVSREDLVSVEGITNPASEPANVKPSLIVLPLRYQQTEKGSSVLSEAISHELIQSFSRMRWLRVIARGTAFQFRSPDPDLQLIGQQLSVRYALSGSLETLKRGWAIHVELADCNSTEVLWAERFEALEDTLHEIRQQIIARIISSLEIYIPLHEANRALQQPPQLLDAWSNYHLGLRYMFRFNQRDNANAKLCFQRAIELDPNFARAWGGLSFTRFQDAFVTYDNMTEKAIADARQFAERSVDLDPLDPFANLNMGRSFWLEGDALGSLSWLDRAVTLSPNFAQGHYSCAFSAVLQGDAQQALLNSERALNTSPLDPLLYAIHGVRSFSHLICNDMAAAIASAEKAAQSPGAHFLIHMMAAMMNAMVGDSAKAKYWHDRAVRMNPDANASQFFAAFPFVDEAFKNKLVLGLTRAEFA